MKLKNISCTQFAGVRDREIALEDGINVIFGQNESGKSTLVNLISRTLFQKAKLDGRSNKDFKRLYFPSARKDSSIQGDFADGSVTFETEEGRYILKKEWGSDSRVMLHTPQGVLRETNKIDEVLRQILRYGEGVYSDMLLLPQNNMDKSLETLLDDSPKSDSSKPNAKKEIMEVASQAFAESDGVSINAVEEKVQGEIDRLADKHWDEERSAPMSNKEGRWSIFKTNKDKILAAYYQVEDAQAVLTEIDCLSGEADAAAHNYTEQTKRHQQAQTKSETFRKCAARLKEKQNERDKIGRLRKEQIEYSDALNRWPAAEKEAADAQALQKEQNERNVLDQYAQARKVNEELAKVDQTLVERECPTPEDIKIVQDAERKITNLENQLRGMNLNAVVHMLGGHSMEIITLRDGKKLSIDGDKAALTEAVKITIPGVMEMELAPANVDTAAIKAAVTEETVRRSAVLERYGTETLDALKILKDNITEAKKQHEDFCKELKRILQGTDFETLKAQATDIKDTVRPAKEIQRAIDLLCGRNTLDFFLGKVVGDLEDFCRNYTNQDNLRSMLENVNRQLEEMKTKSDSLDDIPAEYRDVTDPEDYQNRLDKAVKEAAEAKDQALNDKAKAEGALETYRKNLMEDPEDQLAQAKRKFNEIKETLHHWRHIQKVIRDQKAAIHNNPMEDIARSFAHYLNIISDGRVASEFPQTDKLQMNIYSDNFQLDYQKLSEGTKETVALAFRLAVLDHLFPEGGGLAVFDDPFTDMDLERMHQSCELLKDSAQRHQIIVLTCREEYIPLLGGNAIRI